MLPPRTRRTRLSLLVPALSALGCASCISTSGPPTIDAKAELADRYVFRGVPRVETMVLQGWTSMGLPLENQATASMSWWGNLNLADDDSSAAFAGHFGGKFTEIDVTPEYAWNHSDWSFAVGLTSYSFPQHSADTSELYVSASLDALGVSPNVTAYLDIDEVDGMYVVGSVSRAFRLSEKVQALAAGSVAFSDSDHSRAAYGTGESGLADVISLLEISYERDAVSSWSLSFSNSTMAWGAFDDDVEDLGYRADSFTVAVGAIWRF